MKSEYWTDVQTPVRTHLACANSFVNSPLWILFTVIIQYFTFEVTCPKAHWLFEGFVFNICQCDLAGIMLFDVEMVRDLRSLMHTAKKQNLSKYFCLVSSSNVLVLSYYKSTNIWVTLQQNTRPCFRSTILEYWSKILVPMPGLFTFLKKCLVSEIICKSVLRNKLLYLAANLLSLV